MKPMIEATVDDLDLASSLRKGLDRFRPQLPRSEWQSLETPVGESLLLGWLRESLLSGHRVAPGEPLPVLKAGGLGIGVRPVLLMDPADQVVYRALADRAVAPTLRQFRSAAAFQNFKQSLRRPNAWTRGGAATRDGGYILEADVTAYYDSIHHDILADELVASGASWRVTESLVDFLGELMGAPVGIPQSLEASDWLSELLVGRVERTLIRDGYLVSRYCDDFQIGCRSYSDAVRANESLANYLRSQRLHLTASKTTLSEVRFSTRPTSGQGGPAPAKQRPSHTEYGGPSGSVFKSSGQPEADSSVDGLRLRIARERPKKGLIKEPLLSPEEAEVVAEGMRSASTANDPHLLDLVGYVVRFHRNWTLAAMLYLTATGPSAPDRALPSVRELKVTSVGLGVWQRYWLIEAIAAIGVDREDELREWVEGHLEPGRNALLASQAAITMGRVGGLSVEEVDRGLRTCPSALEYRWLIAARLGVANGSIPRGYASILASESTRWAAYLEPWA